MAHVQKQASLVKLYLDRTAIDVDKGQAGLRIRLHQAGSDVQLGPGSLVRPHVVRDA